LLALLSERTTLSEPSQTEEVCRDSSDNYLLALAHASSAGYLVTRDEDLLTLRRYGSTEIIYPARFLRLLSEAGEER